MRLPFSVCLLAALCFAPQLARAAEDAAPMRPARHYQLAVYYEPGGNPKGMRYRVSAKKFAIDKKFKTEKLYSSLEILGSILERDGKFLVDSWLQLEIATAPKGGEISETVLLKTVYPLKPNKKTLVLKAPAMRVWMEIGSDAGVPKSRTKKGPQRPTGAMPPSGKPRGGRR